MKRQAVLMLPFVLLFTVLATGCQTLYVHDSAIEKSMTDARTSFDNAKIHEVFDRQSKYFDQLQAEEIAAVKARDAAQRDGQLLLFLNGNEGIDGLTLMSNDIDTRLLFLYRSDSDPDHPLWRHIDNMGISASMDQTIQTGYERAVRDYRKEKGTRPTDCISVLAGLAKGNDSEQADTAYKTLKHRCEQIKQASNIEAAAALPVPPPPAAAGPGAPPTIEYGAFSFPLNYYVAQNQLMTLQAELTVKQNAAEELNKDLQKRKKALEESLAMGTTTQQQVEELVNEIHNALSKAGPYVANPYAKKVISGQLAKEIQDIIDATASATPAAKLASAANTLATAATVDTSRAAATASDTRVPDALRASLVFLRAAAGVGDAFSNPPRIPHPNALAVGRAQMSYSRDVANAEVADLEAQVDAARSQLNAILTAAYMLSRAKTEIWELQKKQKISLGPGQGLTDFLSKPDTSHDAYRHATAALFYYATAWNRGQILADEIEVERNIASRRATMERSRRASQAWMETIKPGLDTLVAYGNGGIDPKTVAQLLGGLGLMATGIGVNR